MLSLIQAVRAPRLNFIDMAIKDKKVGSEKVVKKIVGMVANLMSEQGVDDDKKDLSNRVLTKMKLRRRGLSSLLPISKRQPSAVPRWYVREEVSSVVAYPGGPCASS